MRIGLLALVLALSPALPGCGGGGGSDESVSRQRVFPSVGFTGRQLRVEISGDDTNWKDGTTVEFGPGVTVNSVTVESPTVLFADLTIAFDVAPGLRDVLIKSGDDQLTLKDGFQLESPISMKFRGTLAQGSVVTFAINNHDFEKPFDTTSEGGSIFEPPTFPNIVIEGPAGVQFSVDSVTEYSITGIALINVDAVPGGVTVSSGPAAEALKSRTGADVAIAARAPIALTSGTPVEGMVTEPLGSTLYEFTTTAATNIALMSAASANADASPGVIVLGPTGTFDDFLGFTQDFAAVLPATKLYAIYWDNSGSTAYNYTLRAASLEPTTSTENEPGNNTATTAVTVADPAVVTGGQLADETDEDWYAIDVAAADVGKRIYVMTTGTDPETDTVVQFYTGASGTTTFGGESSDNGFHERHRSPAITAAGKYWVKVFASSYFDPAHKPYDVAVWVE